MKRLLCRYSIIAKTNYRLYSCDREWFSLQTPELYYHKTVCMEGNHWPVKIKNPRLHEDLYYDKYSVADDRIERKYCPPYTRKKLASPFNYATGKEIPTINTRFKDFDPDIFDFIGSPFWAFSIGYRPTHEDICKLRKGYGDAPLSVPLNPDWFCASSSPLRQRRNGSQYPRRASAPRCQTVTSCRQSDLPALSIIPGRITIILKEDEELLILPDVINYPLKRNPNAKESNGWILPGPTENYKLRANLAPGTRLFVAPIEDNPIKRGGGPIVRTGKKEPRQKERIIDTSLKWLTTCEYRREYLTNRGKLNASNGRPRTTYKVSADIGSNIDATKRESFQDDYESPIWSSGDQDPSGENADFGNVIPHLEESFLGEGYLIQGEEGSERISLDKETTTHYCKEEHDATIRKPVDMWQKCSNRYYLKSLYREHEVKKHRSYMGRTVWYNEPNKNDRRWYCLICVKKSGKIDVGNKKRYHRDDIELIKAIGKLGRKKNRPDYRLEIHYPNHRERLDCEISKYLKSQADKDQFDPNNNGKSFFQHEPTRDDEYLRTAVLTAIKGIDHKPYKLKSKGGRRRGKGANSIKKWCDRRFAHHVPYDDKILISKYQLDPKPRGVIDVIFALNSIRKILNELKPTSDKHPKN